MSSDREKAKANTSPISTMLSTTHYQLHTTNYSLIPPQIIYHNTYKYNEYITTILMPCGVYCTSQCILLFTVLMLRIQNNYMGLRLNQTLYKEKINLWRK